MNIIDLLKISVINKASDLHLSSGLSPMMRVNGDIVKIDLPPLEAGDIKILIHSLMSTHIRQVFEKEKEVDFAYAVDELARFRVNVFEHSRGIGAVLRTIPAKILTLAELGFSDVFSEISSFNKGLVLVTGPTGSGKSTTLAAMVDYINTNKPQHILTIEDPIEFTHTSKKSIVNQRELNSHTRSFANALKSALREDPDTILVGEMRDIETIRLALTAAETGHLVFATLHTSSAVKTIDRIVDVFPVGEKDMVRTMISESLQAVVSQTLIKKKNRSGRVAAYEIMLVNPAIRNLIRENKLAQINTALQTGSNSGMQTMDQHLLKLLRAGEISIVDAQYVATQKNLFIG